MAERRIEMPSDFDGVARLFPLPNLVLFPGVIQALNVFEPRYRMMTEEALEQDGLITMAMLKPEQLATAIVRPAIFETVCVGKILTHAKLENGCYNLLVAGVHRARILEEVQFELPFRKARVELIRDVVEDEQKADELRLKIVERFLEILPNNSHLDRESLESLLDSNVATGQLIDLIAYSCGATPLELQKMLDTHRVCQRAELILKVMRSMEKKAVNEQAAARPSFPPDFSLN
jgi:ATP-dependent Lon protease